MGIEDIPADVFESVNSFLQMQEERPEGFSHASGGCINNGGRLQTSQSVYFLKWNNKNRFPGMFQAEEKGLNRLLQTKAIKVPRPFFSKDCENHSYIFMECVEQGPRNKDYWEVLGKRLAAMHSNTNNNFGLDHDNYIGSLPQSNTHHHDWTAFFIEERLEPQLRLLHEKRLSSSEVTSSFSNLFPKLENYFPKEKPALLHGDLWSGNLITNETGEPCIIDPAVYFGHREMELAFTTLFGGFDQQFYQTYQEIAPLEKGFDQRIDLYNLYPLLVHANLFGSSYLNSVMGILKRYV